MVSELRVVVAARDESDERALRDGTDPRVSRILMFAKRRLGALSAVMCGSRVEAQRQGLVPIRCWSKPFDEYLTSHGVLLLVRDEVLVWRLEFP